MSSRAGDVERLRRDVEGALKRALDPADVLPMLHRLVRTAPADSDESVFAHRQLAELIAPRHPWRAALYARRVVALRPTDDRGWAILAFAQTLLENYRFAASAYARALTCSPKNPWYAHNLGHLLDVALGRPNEALPWLAAAFAAARDHVEVATSYAHALARAGDLTMAKRILTRAMRATGTGPTREQAALWRWFERGAPGPKRDGRPGESRESRGPGRPGEGRGSVPGASGGSRSRGFLPSLVPVDLPESESDDETDDATDPGVGATTHGMRGTSDGSSEDARDDARESGPPPPAHASARRTSRAQDPRSFRPRQRATTGPGTDADAGAGAIEASLIRHAAHLPFDAAQRARACDFAREVQERRMATPTPTPSSSSTSAAALAAPDVTAAAVAYAVVAHEDIPLTQAEVAATFRVPVSALRVRYHQLRATFLNQVPARLPGRLETPPPPVTTGGGAGAGEARTPLRASRSSRPPRSSSSASARKVKK